MNCEYFQVVLCYYFHMCPLTVIPVMGADQNISSKVQTNASEIQIPSLEFNNLQERIAVNGELRVGSTPENSSWNLLKSVDIQSPSSIGGGQPSLLVLSSIMKITRRRYSMLRESNYSLLIIIRLGRPVVGDWNGDGIPETGVYRPPGRDSSSRWTTAAPGTRQPIISMPRTKKPTGRLLETLSDFFWKTQDSISS